MIRFYNFNMAERYSSGKRVLFDRSEIKQADSSSRKRKHENDPEEILEQDGDVILMEEGQCSSSLSTHASSSSQTLNTSSKSDSSSNSQDTDGQDLRGITGSSSEEATRSNSESPTIFPTRTSEWTEEVLSRIKVTLAGCNCKPEDITSSFIGLFDQKKRPYQASVLSDLLEARGDQDLKIRYCKKAFTKVVNFDIDQISEIPEGKFEEVYKRILSKINSKRKAMCKAKQPKISQAIMKLDVLEPLRLFFEQLVYMKEMAVKLSFKKSSQLPEGMFQELFVRFARIFGLIVVCQPNLIDYDFVVHNETVNCKPDGLICYPLHDNGNGIVAVIEVKREYSKLEEKDTERVLRSEKKVAHESHIDTKLMGQHTGEMIGALSASIFGEKGISGFIVQGTEVTLVSFVAEEKYLEYLAEKKFPASYKGAEIKYSKKCNFLRMSGRLDLVNSLFGLASWPQVICTSNSQMSI